MPDIYSYLTNVNSFPTTKMGSVNKLITENSLTRLINRLVDVDGFIITDGLAKENSAGSEIIGNGGKHLNINSNLKVGGPQPDIIFRDDLLEFVLRGYYFSVPFSQLKNIILPDPQSPPQETTGLFARIFIDNHDPNYPEIIGQTAYEDDPVTFEEGRHYGVQFFKCPIDSKPIPYHPILSNDESEPIEGLGTIYLYYDLMLLEYIVDQPDVSNGLYLPFESLCKFDSHSQSIIDGGEIKFYS